MTVDSAAISSSSSCCCSSCPSETGLPSSRARVFAVNCFSLSAVNLFLLIPPFYGAELVSDCVATVRNVLCPVVAAVQILLWFLRPNDPKPKPKPKPPTPPPPTPHLPNHRAATAAASASASAASAAANRRKVQSLIQAATLMCLSTFSYHVMIVLFGAPLLQSMSETFHLALLMSILTTLPLCLNSGPDYTIWCRLCVGSGETMVELYVYILYVCTLVGTWLGAFPIPLDWDRPWQAWPITCCIGALIGNSLANSFMGIWILYTEQQPKPKRRKRV